jgi:hypothetical protein
MALATGSPEEGHPPTKLETDAVCTLDQTDAGFRITTMQPDSSRRGRGARPRTSSSPPRSRR